MSADGGHNAAYRNTTPLVNPKNDANDVAAALKALGFETLLETDLDKRGMDDAFRRFARLARESDAALFFYAGHAMQFAGVNYLMPVDAKLQDEADLQWEMSRVDDVVSDLARAKNIRIVVLDACRDNPLADRLRMSLPADRSAAVGRGLVRPERTHGLITAFATQHGQVAKDGVAGERNSPFTTAFLKHVGTAGIEVATVFRRVAQDVSKSTDGRQLPELSISLLGEFYFAGPQVAVVAPPVVPSIPPQTSPKPAVGISPDSGTRTFTAEQERALKPKDTFKECETCPEMVVVPAGSFTIGSPASENGGRTPDEGPQRRVTFARQFAVGKFAVTFDQFAAFVKETGHDAGSACYTYEGNTGATRSRSWRNPGFTQGGSHPAVCINWDDAKAYVAWLSRKTGKTYRLLSEAEREYVARAGTTTPFWWGSTISTSQANYNDKVNDYSGKTMPVDSFQPNPWGLYQVHGNVWEWVEDCLNVSYSGAPADGSAWTAGDCSTRVLRGGSWNLNPGWFWLRSALRGGTPPRERINTFGFRVARTLLTP